MKEKSKPGNRHSSATKLRLLLFAGIVLASSVSAYVDGRDSAALTPAEPNRADQFLGNAVSGGIPGGETGSESGRLPPGLFASGMCPGPITLNVFSVTPNGRVAVGWSHTQGPFVLSDGLCAGTVLDLATPRLLTIVTADRNGEAVITANAPPAVCGVFLQAVDLTTCQPSNPTILPVERPEHMFTNTVAIAMPEDNGVVTTDETDLDLFIDAATGFVVVELNGVAVAVEAIDPIDELLIPHVIAQLENEGFVVNVETELETFLKFGGPFHLAHLSLVDGDNTLTAFLMEFIPGQPLNIISEDNVNTFKDPRGMTNGSAAIYNVTFNGSVIAKLNITAYGVGNITRVRLSNGSVVPYTSDVLGPLNVTFVNGSTRFSNGTLNTSGATTTSQLLNFSGVGKLWIDIRFEDENVPPGFDDWRWIQVVTSNFPPISPPHILDPPITSVDPPNNLPGEDDEPFYYNGGELARDPSLKHHFKDHPGTMRWRDDGNFITMTWSAELCHVGVKAGAPDVILNSCITYGFTINPDGSITENPLTNTGPPSQTFTDTLSRDFPGYDFN